MDKSSNPAPLVYGVDLDVKHEPSGLDRHVTLNGAGTANARKLVTDLHSLYLERKRNKISTTPVVLIIDDKDVRRVAADDPMQLANIEKLTEHGAEYGITVQTWNQWENVD